MSHKIVIISEEERTGRAQSTDVFIVSIDHSGDAVAASGDEEYTKIPVTISCDVKLALAYISITAIEPERARLPISKTGYRSLFTQAEIIDAAGGPVAYTLAWLEDAASDPEWIKYKAQSAQLELF